MLMIWQLLMLISPPFVTSSSNQHAPDHTHLWPADSVVAVGENVTSLNCSLPGSVDYEQTLAWTVTYGNTHYARSLWTSR